MMLRDDPGVAAFKDAAERYCALIEKPVGDPEDWVAAVLPALAQVYAAAHRVPAVECPGPEDGLPADCEVTQEQWGERFKALLDFLGRSAWYWAYCDPTEPKDTDERPIQHCLADDLADIWRDLKPGLRAWALNDDALLPVILWNWTALPFTSHWGRHAVSALRALHELVHQRGIEP